MIVVDSSVKKELESRLGKCDSKNTLFEIGLLIGHYPAITTSSDVINIVGVIPTLENPDQVGEGISGTKSLDKDWVSEHARQVSRMLCGNMTIVGLYLVSKSNATLDQDESNLSKILKSINELLCLTASKSTNFALLSFIGETKSLNIKSTSPSTMYKFSKCEYKETNVIQEYGCFRMKLVLKDLSLKIAIKDLDSIHKDLDNSFKPLFEESMFIIDDKSLDLSSSVSSIVKQQHQQQKESNIIDILVQYFNTSAPPTPLNETSNYLIFNDGVVECLTYAHEKESFSNVVSGLRKDLVKSIATRFELLLEDQENKEFSVNSLLESSSTRLPRKVNISYWSNNSSSSKTSTISICDYLFQDESISDCSQRLHDLLQYDKETINENSSNIISIESESVQTKKSTTKTATTNSNSNNNKNNNNNNNNKSSTTPSSLSSKSTTTTSPSKSNSTALVIGLLSIIILLVAIFITKK
ncbi:hypothetical protein CYY_002645 [Polysphondylium violaceum]|uniref:Protein odr-4 homolog n=1 Tax=Polysphondylium violaceum TaxID=133409 RepID=A0A8J4Q7N3_9MYCE|nr:hypothetical protein CYY_002645 [Polysphondylium violaceum]